MDKKAERRNPVRLFISWLRRALAVISRGKRFLTRGTAANLLMIAFIMLTGIGAFLIYPPSGFIVGGVGCGVFGFILGLE